MADSIDTLNDTAATEADQFPHTCQWCKSAPATHLVIADVVPQGRHAAERQEWRLCGPCAHQTTVLPASFTGWWVFELAPDACGDGPYGPEPPPPLSLTGRVTAILTGAGHTDARDTFPGGFLATDGTGVVIVTVPWSDATDGERKRLLARLAAELRDGGLDVAARRHYLQVTEAEKGAGP
jgi:hypothetical protein